MNGLDRIKQLTDLGIDVRVGNANYFTEINFEGPKKTFGLRILAVYPDGSKEYASPIRTRLGTKEDSREFKTKLLDVLRMEGLDVESTRGLGSKDLRSMKIDLHTLVLPSKETYQFLLPSTDYLKK